MIQIGGTTADKGKEDPSWTFREIRALLEALGTKVEAQGRRSLGPSKITRNGVDLKVHVHSMEHIEGSTKRLEEALQYRGIRDGNKGSQIQHDEERVAMAGKWKPEQNKY